MSFVEAGVGPTVLLGSSYLWDADMWRPQLEALSSRFRVIAPDLWGHGASQALPAGTRDMRDLAHHHLALLDALGVERCSIIGLSVGGMWGAELAQMAPERVERLVLVATSLAAEPEASRDRNFALLDTIETLGALPEPIRAVVVPLFFSQTTPAKRPDLVTAFDAKLRKWPSARLVDSVVPLGRIIFGRRDAMDVLDGLPMRCLVMTGEEDVARTREEGRAMAERIGCPFLSVPGAGHIANLEAPEFVTSALLDLLAA
ncbi:MAG: alpha/beta fold hydrolase [Janthinobacterium lividum]